MAGPPLRREGLLPGQLAQDAVRDRGGELVQVHVGNGLGRVAVLRHLRSAGLVEVRRHARRQVQLVGHRLGVGGGPHGGGRGLRCRRAAEAEGTDLTNFTITATLARARDVLADRRLFVLDESAWEEFIAMLERPVSAKSRLAAVFAEPTMFDEP